MPSREIMFRLFRADDLPPSNPASRAFTFGLQANRGDIVAGTCGRDGGFVFDFALTLKAGAAGQPVFTGRFASGPSDDRFVYLAWRAPEGDYINRVKGRLGSIEWAMIEQAERSGGCLTADLTGWLPGDRRKFPDWTVLS